MKALHWALALVLGAFIALAFAGWLRPASVFSFISAVPFCQ